MTQAPLDAALRYAARGWPVLPVHSVRNGICTCRKGPECTSPAKHPRITNGVKRASTDPEKIRKWWTRWPDANVAVATGDIIALDVDLHGEDGETSLALLELEHGELPPTLEAKTGSGGRHLIFRHPGGRVKNRVALAPGLDLRSEGGYIVVAPSVHASGGRYEWTRRQRPADLGGHPLVHMIREEREEPRRDRQQALPATSRDVARARGILHAQCRRIVGLTDGRRHALILAARQCAGYIHLGLPEHEIFSSLMDAGRRCGADEKHDIERHIRYGIETGRTQPLDLPPDDRPERATKPTREPRKNRAPGIMERLSQVALDMEMGDKDLRARAMASLFEAVDELGEAWANNEPQIRAAFTKIRAIYGYASQVEDLVRMITARTKKSKGSEAAPGDIVVGPDIAQIEDQAITAIAERDTSMYQRGGQLVHVAEGAIHSLDAYALRSRLSRSAHWVRRSSQGDLVECAPPLDICRGILARSTWPELRPLDGIVHEPILRPDGTVLQRPGYDPITRAVYEPNADYPWVPDEPTLVEARGAAARLLLLIQDFPAVNEAAQAAWLASVLTPLARYAFDGPAPWFMVTANVRGTGKSLMLKAASIITTGREASAFSVPSSDEEMRKLLTSVIMSGDRVMLFDNIAKDIGWPSLDAVLTSNRHGDRILGKSERIDITVRTVLYGTANNPILRADTSRRILPIPLMSPRDDPENRPASDFEHANLAAHIREHRPHYVADALTVLRAYCAAGRPCQGLTPWGSYEEWSALVCGAITWLGIADPRQNVGELADIDMGRIEMERLVVEILNHCGSTWWTAREIVAKLQSDRSGHFSGLGAALQAALGSDSISERRLGRYMVQLRGRVISMDGDRWRFEARLNRKAKIYEYRVVFQSS